MFFPRQGFFLSSILPAHSRSKMCDEPIANSPTIIRARLQREKVCNFVRDAGHSGYISPAKNDLIRSVSIILWATGLQNSVSPNLSPVDMASLAAAMRMGNNGDMSGGTQGSTGPQQQGVQATGPEQTLRMHQAEALLRSQAEAALRLAVSATSRFIRFNPDFVNHAPGQYYSNGTND